MAAIVLRTVVLLCILCSSASGFTVPAPPPLHKKEKNQAVRPSGGGTQDTVDEKQLAQQAVLLEPPVSPAANWFSLFSFGAVLGLLIGIAGNVEPAFAAAAQGTDWTYRDADKWSTAFPKCEGQEQSPVDLSGGKPSEGSKTDNLQSRFTYVPVVGAELFNNKGTTAQVSAALGKFVLVDGEYKAKQFLFHFPSEHLSEGARAAGELHIMHQKVGSSGLDDIAVVSILLDTGPADNSPEQEFMKNLGFGSEMPGDRMKLFVEGAVDLNAFANELGGAYWHYKGSLTTPPCVENVHWYVLDKHAVISNEMVESFNARFPTDSRPVQPLGTRVLQRDSLSAPGEYGTS